MFVYNYTKILEHICRVRWTCTYVLMHIHILTKVWKQKRLPRMHTRVPTGIHIIACNYAKGLEKHGMSVGHAYVY